MGDTEAQTATATETATATTSVADDLTTKEPGVLVLGVHGGKFHLDDAMSCFLMSALYGARCGRTVRIRRSTADGRDLDDCDIVMDVGMVYDHAARRYDHHQRGFAEVYDDEMTRKCGRALKMASTGLLWRHYGPAIVRALWPAPRAGQQHCVAAPSATDVALVVRRVYTTLLAAIDADDNGLEAYAPDAFAGGVPPTPLYRDGTGLARRVDRLNVAWNEALTPGLADTRFAAAVALAGADFTAVLEGIVLSWLPARQVVADAYARRRTYRANGHVLVNDVGGCPYRDHLRDIERDAAHAGAAHAEPAVLYVVSWDRVRCQWSATATEARPGSFESKLAFPPAWRGLRNDELVAATGIPNCVFVHASGFLACNTDRDDLLAMIDRSIEMQPERYQLYKNVP